jgi:S-adenosylmethionine:tRNA ribosyltransferase-isomerase
LAWASAGKRYPGPGGREPRPVAAGGRASWDGALETVAAADGTVSEGQGWTDLVVNTERGLRTIDGLLSGWHKPESSYLALLEAAGGELLARSYWTALEHGYLWQEFGDLHLILP